jgi:hypothetical protein
VVRMGPRHLEVMPPNTNRGPIVAGGWVRLGGRTLAGGSCRDEIVAALHALEARRGGQVFSVRHVYAEMVGIGTRYTESTVSKTMQRIKSLPRRPPMVLLERAGSEGFRVAEL